jgi:hypothetical protein
MSSETPHHLICTSYPTSPLITSVGGGTVLTRMSSKLQSQCHHGLYPVSSGLPLECHLIS